MRGEASQPLVCVSKASQMLVCMGERSRSFFIFSMIIA